MSVSQSKLKQATKARLKQKLMSKKMNRKVESIEELISHGSTIDGGVYQGGIDFLNHLPEVIQKVLLGPKGDITVKKIEENPAFKKLNQEKRGNLDKILKICAARIHYNELLAKFYGEETDENIKQHLNNLLGPGLKGQQCSDSMLQIFKAFFSKGPLGDADWYLELLNIININIEKDNIFEKIERKLSEKLWDMNEDENARPNHILIKFEWFKYYFQTPEYLEGRENDYVQEMLDYGKAYLSPRYLCFIEHNPLGGKRVHSGANERISKNDEYCKSVAKKIEELESVIRAIKKLGIALNKKDRKKISEDLVSVLHIELVALKKKAMDKFSRYEQLQKTFDEIYDLGLKIDKHIQIAKALKEKYQKLKQENQAKEIEDISDSAIINTVVNDDTHQEQSTSNQKSSNSSETKKEKEAVLPYYDYKRAFDSVNSTQKERRLSKDSSGLLMQILCDDEKSIPNFEIKRSELDKLFHFLGGKLIGKGGSKFRYELNNFWGDIPYLKVTLPQHTNHGQDDRNDTVSKFTVMQFRSLMMRAGIKDKMGLLLHSTQKNSHSGI